MAIFIVLRQSYKEMPYILAFENPPAPLHLPLPLSARCFADGFSNVGHMDVTWLTRGFFFRIFRIDLFNSSNILRSVILFEILNRLFSRIVHFEQTLPPFKSIPFERKGSPRRNTVWLRVVTIVNCNEGKIRGRVA